MVASLLGMVYFKVETDKLKEKFATDYVCPKDSLSDEFKEMTYIDQSKDEEERAGLLHCYCSAYLSKDTQGIFNVNFKEYTEDGKPEDPLFCYSWLKNQAV